MACISDIIVADDLTTEKNFGIGIRNIDSICRIFSVLASEK